MGSVVGETGGLILLFRHVFVMQQCPEQDYNVARLQKQLDVSI